MSIDTSQYKNRLKEYLAKKGVPYKKSGSTEYFKCPHPDHKDENPSAVFYENDGNNILSCMSNCGESWDIFEVAGLLDKINDFPGKIKAVEFILGSTDIDDKSCLSHNSVEIQQKQAPKPEVNPISLSLEAARELYKTEEFLERAKRFGWGDKITGTWLYKNRISEIIGVDIRFEGGEREKNVLTFWYNGKTITSKTPPDIIYNLDKIYNSIEKPILIVEGCKSVEFAENKGLDKYFVITTWNGGTNRVNKHDWAFLSDREIYIYPDDDKPGQKAAEEIQKQLPNAKIIKPLIKAREIKKTGADIVEALKITTTEKLVLYIMESLGAGATSKKQTKNPQNPLQSSESSTELSPGDLPFKILGSEDDGFAYFLDRHNKLYSAALDSLSKNKLLNLASLKFWHDNFAYKSRVQWDEAVDFIIETSGKEFKIENIRGRGAWRESDGRLCYHDGVKTYGEPDKNRIYRKKSRKDIGLEDNIVDFEIRKKIVENVSKMSFETQSDAVRCLSWSVLAPFAGALPWRPASFITGPSGSGKTSIVDYLIKKISKPEIFTGGESTTAGVRQYLQNDSCAVVIEEAETDTKKKRENRDDLFSLMRQSTSDDAPKAAKGTKDGKGMTFSMKNMFCFVAISPEVESVADDNRILRINMIKPQNNNWNEIRKDLNNLVTEENCRGLRALTWKKLPIILKMANYLAPLIQDLIKKDTRSSFAEALLMAAYFIIWQNKDSVTKEGAIEFIKENFKNNISEPERDDAEEMIDRLLDESIFYSEDRVNITLREIMQKIATPEEFGREKYIDEFARYGLCLNENNDLVIANNHHSIMKIIEKNKGYQRILWRHKNIKDKSKIFRIAGKTRRCVVIGNLLEKDKE